MARGLDALYVKGDPGAAAAEFRKVLARNPEHYGANFQLAMALERAGRADEAKRAWEKSLGMAEAIKDEKTADLARKHLGLPPPPPGEDSMKAGLDALYVKRDASAAITAFRRVLESHPGHYGATFQLAKALDQAGRPGEARPYWETALRMAESYRDASTVALVKQRLARRP